MDSFGSDFCTVLRGGYGVERGSGVGLVFVDTAGGDAFSSAVRVGMLARLLSDGVDWQEAAEATCFSLEAQPADHPGPGLRVQFGDSGPVGLDVFDVAADPIGAVRRMVQDAGGAPT